MIVRLVFACAVLACVTACEQRDSSGYIYADDDPRLIIALSDAKRENPKYFKALSQTGAIEHFIGRQVFGNTVECVVFENHSSIVMENSLPMYCFREGSTELIAKL